MKIQNPPPQADEIQTINPHPQPLSLWERGACKGLVGEGIGILFFSFLVFWCVFFIFGLLFLILGQRTVALDNPEQKVAEVIKDYVVAKYPQCAAEDIRVTFKLAEKTFEELKALDENTQFKVMEVYPEFKPVGNAIFPILLSPGAKKILLRAKVEVIRKIAAAAKLIKKGKALEASDIKFEERDVALLPQKYFVESFSLISKEARISIPENSTIFEWMVGESPLVRRGAQVSIVATAPGLVVKTRGEALEDGYPGAEIKVKRADSKKTITGIVISANEVEVKVE